MLARLTSGIALASIAALVLVGCTPGSDERVANESREAWDEYLSVLVAYGAAPADATREGLLAVSTADVADGQLRNFEQAADAGVHSEGARATSAYEVVEADGDEIQANVCVDISAERVIASDGEDITDPQRPSSLAYSVTIASDDGDFLVTSYAEYDGPTESNPCA